jgi:hypothetical protein
LIFLGKRWEHRMLTWRAVSCEDELARDIDSAALLSAVITIAIRVVIENAIF